MAKSVRRRPPAAAKPLVVETRFRPYEAIEEDLNSIKCRLACATVSLNQAQDTCDASLAAQSWTVIRACFHDLARFEDELDSWYVSHEHLPKDVRHD